MSTDFISARDPGDETPAVAGGEREALRELIAGELRALVDAADGDPFAFDSGREADRILALLSARPAPEREEVLDPQGVREAAIALMQLDGGPGVPDFRRAMVAVSAYLRVSRPEPVSAPEVAIGCDRCCASAAVYRTPRVSLCYPCLDEILAEYEMRNEADAVSEPEPAPGAEPVEPVAWRYKWDGEDRWFLADRIDAVPLAIRHDMRTMDADIRGRMEALVPLASPPSERAGPKPEPIGRCADCGSHETPVGEYPLTSCISCGAPWRNYAREERAGERETALREALEEAETSLTAVAMHSVQDLMRNDARRVVMQIREALAASPAGELVPLLLIPEPPEAS